MNFTFTIPRCGRQREVTVRLRDGRLHARCSCIAGVAGVTCSHVIELLRACSDPDAEREYLARCADPDAVEPLLAKLRSLLPPDLLEEHDPELAAYAGEPLDQFVGDLGIVVGPSARDLLLATAIPEPPVDYLRAG